jgi:hypothetical protein
VQYLAQPERFLWQVDLTRFKARRHSRAWR